MPMRVLALATLLASGEALLVGQPAMAAPRAGAAPLCKGRLTPEERRRQKLEVGTNWPPRTSTVKGQGYQFFQGSTPKTSNQEDLPSFFSADNFADVEVKPIQAIITATGLGSFVAVASVLLGGTTPKMDAPNVDKPAVEKAAPKISAPALPKVSLPGLPELPKSEPKAQKPKAEKAPKADKPAKKTNAQLAEENAAKMRPNKKKEAKPEKAAAPAPSPAAEKAEKPSKMLWHPGLHTFLHGHTATVPGKNIATHK